MLSAQNPLWLTIVTTLIGGLGLGSLLAGLVQQRAAAKTRHKEWVKDNKKLEWRELIDALESAMKRMRLRFPPEYGLREGPRSAEEDWPGGMELGIRVVRNRIFIAEVIKRCGIVDKWDELVRYVLSVGSPRDRMQQGGLPTLNGYTMKSAELQDLLIKVSREDLGIEEPHH